MARAAFAEKSILTVTALSVSEWFSGANEGIVTLQKFDFLGSTCEKANIISLWNAGICHLPVIIDDLYNYGGIKCT